MVDLTSKLVVKDVTYIDLGSSAVYKGMLGVQCALNVWYVLLNFLNM